MTKRMGVIRMWSGSIFDAVGDQVKTRISLNVPLFYRSTEYLPLETVVTRNPRRMGLQSLSFQQRG